MINIKNLAFSYKQTDFNLSLDSLNLDQGSSLLITGESGCGKSTLLKLMSGELIADSGSIEVYTQLLENLSSASKRLYRLQNIGMVFQNSQLLDYLSVVENILLPSKLAGKKVDSDKLKELTNNCKIDNYLKRRPLQLSEGEKQRAAVCRALINTPQLVLADEPTSHLDPHNSKLITNLLLSESKKLGATLVVISHDLSTVDLFDQHLNLDGALC